MREGTADNAGPIAQLLYQNDSLSDVHPDFYRPRWLGEQVLAGRVLSSVAVHGGAIVGHHASLPSPDGALAETGVAVVARPTVGRHLRTAERANPRAAAALGLAPVSGAR